MKLLKTQKQLNEEQSNNANVQLGAGWTSIDEMLPIDDYNNQFRLLCYYPRGNDVGSNYKIVWTFNFKSEIGVSHWMVLPAPPACT
jgi:hypothetical protein